MDEERLPIAVVTLSAYAVSSKIMTDSPDGSSCRLVNRRRPITQRFSRTTLELGLRDLACDTRVLGLLLA